MALQLVVFHWFIMPLSSPVLIQLGILSCHYLILTIIRAITNKVEFIVGSRQIMAHCIQFDT
jgi:hypothetical protein